MINVLTYWYRWSIIRMFATSSTFLCWFDLLSSLHKIQCIYSLTTHSVSIEVQKNSRQARLRRDDIDSSNKHLAPQLFLPGTRLSSLTQPNTHAGCACHRLNTLRSFQPWRRFRYAQGVPILVLLLLLLLNSTMFIITDKQLLCMFWRPSIILSPRLAPYALPLRAHGAGTSCAINLL